MASKCACMYISADIACTFSACDQCIFFTPCTCQEAALIAICFLQACMNCSAMWNITKALFSGR